MKKDPFDPQNFPSEEELEADARRARLRESAEDAAHATSLVDALIYGANRIFASGKDQTRRVEVDITGLDFDAVAKTIYMMPGGCDLVRDGDKVYIQGLDPDFVVWGATQQGYIRGKK